MLASTLFTLTAATLASAAPTSDPSTDAKDIFSVSSFVFGCTVGCDYSFDVTFNGGCESHCSGNLDNDDYVECTSKDPSKSISAYIDDSSDDKNILKLEYEVTNVEEGSRFNYYGEEQVYTATGYDADKQEAEFEVEVSSVTGVA